MAVPVDEECVAQLPMVGGELVIRYRDGDDINRMSNDFGGMGVFLNTQKQAPAFAEFSLIQELPNGKQTEPLPARVVQVVPFGDAPGLVIQFLSMPQSVTAQIQDWRDNPTAEDTTQPEPEPAPIESPFEPEEREEAPQADKDKQDRHSVFERLRKMPIQDRSRFASRAPKLERSILIRDHEPNVIMFLLKNPQLTRGEVIEISKRPTLTHQTVSMILANTQWAQIEELRFNLVMNPRTPLPIAVKLISGLTMKHIREIAKNHGIKEQIKRAALRIVLERSK